MDSSRAVTTPHTSSSPRPLEGDVSRPLKSSCLSSILANVYAVVQHSYTGTNPQLPFSLRMESLLLLDSNTTCGDL